MMRKKLVRWTQAEYLRLAEKSLEVEILEIRAWGPKSGSTSLFNKLPFEVSFPNKITALQIKMRVEEEIKGVRAKFPAISGYSFALVLEEGSDGFTISFSYSQVEFEEAV